MGRSSSVKASGFGSKSFEDIEGVTLSPRQSVGFDCPAGHQFAVVFSLEAVLPGSWDCVRCGGEALRSDGFRAEAKESKPDRSHLDRLRERRTDPELEVLLAERLQLIKAGVIGPNVYERIATAGAARKPAARR